MKILYNHQLPNILKEIKPTYIAVGYIGKDFESFFKSEKDILQIENIVISPRIGTNPKAIDTLKKILGGWEKISFDIKLHSKVYVGKKSALLTSANLSRNGLEVDGLEEIGVLIKNQVIVKELKQYVIKLFEKNSQSDKQKENLLENLYKKHNEIARNKQLKKIKFEQKKTSLSELFTNKRKIPPIKFMWWKDRGNQYIQGNKLNKYKDNFDNCYDLINFNRRDLIKEGDWILCYQIDSKNEIYNDNITWIYVDRVLKHFGTEPYTYIAQQFSSNPANEPFEIDKKFRHAYKEILHSHKELVPNKSDIWLSEKANKRYKVILKEIFEYERKHLLTNT